MDGYKAFTIINKFKFFNEKSYIIGLSANVFQKDKNIVMRLVMVRYLEKPINVHELERVLSLVGKIINLAA